MTSNGMGLADTLIELADTLVSDYDLHDYLDVLLTRSTHLLDSSAGSVLLREGDGESAELLAWTGDRIDVVELFQLRLREGPCFDSITDHDRVIEGDLAHCPRWPRFTKFAVREGYRSVAAFPMQLRDQTIGALNVFWSDPGRAAADDIDAVQTFADMATIGIMQKRALRDARDLSGQLQLALDSRVVIEQAKGMLAEQAGLDMAEAFEVLRRHSRNTNRRIRDAAAEIVAGSVTSQAIVNLARKTSASRSSRSHMRPG